MNIILCLVKTRFNHISHIMGQKHDQKKRGETCE